jgi:hypothetical protein
VPVHAVVGREKLLNLILGQVDPSSVSVCPRYTEQIEIKTPVIVKC